MAESARQKRMRELGLLGDSAQTESPQTQTVQPVQTEVSSRQKRMMELGVIPDTRPKNESNIDAQSQSLMANYDNMVADEPNYVKPEEQLPGRNLPVIGPILKGLDWFSQTPVQHTIADVGQALYTPGGGLANVGGATNAVGNAISRLAPGLGSSLGGRVAQTAAREAIVGAPVAAGNSLARGNQLDQAAEEGAYGAALGGALGAAGPVVGRGLESLGQKYNGTKIGEYINKFFDNPAPAIEPPPSDPLALPMGRGTERINAAQQRSILPYGDEAIAPYGESPTMALPEGNYIPPQRLKVETNPDAYINRAMERSKPIVTENMTPPLENPNELAKWVQGHMNDAGHDVSLNQVRELNYEDLRQLAEEMRSTMSVRDEAVKAARSEGFNLPNLLDGKVPNVAERVAQDAQKRAYGVYPEQLPNIKQPEGFNVSKIGQVAAPETKIGFNRGNVRSAPSAQMSQPPLRQAAQSLRQEQPFSQVRREPSVTPFKPRNTKDELGFAQTVRMSENTSQRASQRLTDSPMLGKTTTNAGDLAKAQKQIEKNGIVAATNDLLAKKKISSVDNFVAQELMQHYQKSGDIDSFLSVLNKTARENRFMGQAIQALSRWNKLDADGAALLANKIVNRGKSAADSVDLTAEQLKPVTAATEKIGAADKTRNLADEVMQIVTNKTNGQALTAEEKAVIEQFQKQVREVNSAAKSFLPKTKKAADVTIKEVGDIKPKERTRDQVVNFLDAKAEKARQRIAAAKNIGFAATQKGNPVIDWSIIGAAKVAKGVVKLSDFSEQMVRDFGQGIKPHINEVFNRSVNIFRRENGLPTIEQLDKVVNIAIKRNELTGQEAQQLKAWANEIGFMSDNFKVEATQDLQLALKRLDKATLGQQVSSTQAANQLLSIPTVLRNVIGNEAMNITDKINKLAAVPIDFALSKLTGQRTIIFKTNNQEGYWSNFVKGGKAGWNGVSPNGQLSSTDIHPEVFGERNPLKYLVKLTGAELQSFDHASYMRAYGETVGTYATLLGKEKGLSAAEIKKQMPELTKQLDDAIFDLADQAGLYATFQDETLLAKGAQGLKRLLNSPTDKASKYLVEKGALPKRFSSEGFGLGDVVIKYAKTPANLVMRGIDYSPLGFMRAIGELIPLVTKKEFNQREAVLALSRAITGTLGLTGMGYALADAGVLTGGSSSDADIRDLEGMAGNGSYKVNWSGLSRYIMSGLDKNAAQYQNGDKLMPYAWLQPAALSIAMGVDANKVMNDRKLGVDKSAVEVALNALSGGLKSMLEQPLVTGVKQVAGIRSWNDVGKIFKGIPSSFVPALAGQARDFTDNATRSTYDPELLKEMMNMVKNRIPGLASDLPQSYSNLGTPDERIQGGSPYTAAQFGNTFLNPVKFSAYTVTPEAKLVMDLIDKTGETKVSPRTVGKTLIVDDPVTKKNKSIELSGEQFTTLQKNVGQATADGLRKMQDYLSDPKVKDEAKVKRVVNLLNDVGDKARNNLRKQMGYKTK